MPVVFKRNSLRDSNSDTYLSKKVLIMRLKHQLSIRYYITQVAYVANAERQCCVRDLFNLAAIQLFCPVGTVCIIAPALNNASTAAVYLPNTSTASPLDSNTIKFRALSVY